MEFLTSKIINIQFDINTMLLTENLSTDIANDTDTTGILVMDRIHPVTYYELAKLIKSSNSKTNALDPCPTDLLKKTFDVHSYVLLKIFNQSFDEDKFPDTFKIVQVTQSLKSPTDDKHLLKNYRPISNLPTIGKLLERIGVIRLIEYIEKSNKLETYQSAYKPAHSTDCITQSVQWHCTGIR